MRCAPTGLLLCLLGCLEACSTCTPHVQTVAALLDRCDGAGAAAALQAVPDSCRNDPELGPLASRLEQRDPEAARTHAEAAIRLLGAGRDAEARAEASLACRADPTNPDAKNLLEGNQSLRQSAELVQSGSASIDRCESAEALRQLEQARQLWPANRAAQDLLARLGRHDPEAARERVKAVIGLLDRGQERQAREELVAACRLDSDSDEARKFLSQIDQNPDVFLTARFGDKRFPYTVQPGDTLSKISGRFLHDDYLFYVLARSNSIQPPNSLEVGQTIRVPGSPSAPPLPERDASAPTVTADPPGGKYAGRTAVTLRARDETDPSPRIWFTTDGSAPAPGRGVAYAKPVDVNPPATLRFVAVDAAGNVSRIGHEVYALDAPCTDDAYRKALEAWRRQDAEATITQCNKALACDPANLGAGNLRVQAVEAMVNLCRIAYQKNACAEAVTECDRALKYDPGNRRALELRKQASECRKRGP